MKFKLFIIVLVNIFCISLSAQRFNGGILAGFNASQIDGDKLAGYNKLGILVGTFVNTDFTNKLGGQLELKYSAKGSSTAKDDFNKLKVRLNYIDIPVLLTYEAVKNLTLQGGLSFNYLFSAKYFDGAWFDDLSIDPNKFETALQAGINYKFFEAFDINLRYNYSLIPVRKEDSGDTFLDEGLWFNNVVSFALYFQIGE
jgi:hypothetical protein